MSVEAMPGAVAAGDGPSADGVERAPSALVISTAVELAELLGEARSKGASVGFVPTMGALHAGHTSLIARARSECYVVAVSVFVNPTQFESANDLAAYPRDPERDVEIASAAGADYVFVPSVEEVYPPGSATVVSVPSLSGVWEGLARPGHFDGVATVVARLFSIVGRSKSYFGEKDFQQLLIVRQVARDLDLPVEVIGCPTVREEDGLAMSSRNGRLGPDERYAAACLYQALSAGRQAIEEGERSPSKVEAAMKAVVGTEPMALLDYAAAVDASNLSTPAHLSGEVRLLIAATFDDVRLIDNLGVNVPVESLSR